MKDILYVLVGKLHDLFDADVRTCIDAIFGCKEKNNYIKVFDYIEKM